MNNSLAVILRKFSFTVLAATCALLLASCAGRKAAEQRYDLKGKVVSVDRAAGRVVIAHEEIPGYMAAMEMPFPIKDRDVLDAMAAGDRVQGTLVVSDLEYWLENPIITKGPIGGADASSAPAGAEPQPGAEVPDFALVNQDGRRTGLRERRGRALLVTFIYTRCPLSDQCPLMSTNFAELNGQLAQDPRLRARTHMLSVTLDPAHDTPQVLREYGAAYAGRGAAPFEHWEFVTGEPEELRRLAQFFGLMYKEEGGQIVHSLRTALVGPDGKLFKVYRGNEWKPAEVLGDLKSLVGES